VTDPSSGNVITPPGFEGLLGGATYTSFVNGKTLPDAWDVELDLPVIDVATSQGFGMARVWGISNQEIAQANDLSGKNIAIYGGMQKGLPLANPAQSGLLVQGNILQCYGNNIGVDRTLDFVIQPVTSSASNPGGIGSIAKPRNIVLNWPKGQPLSSALQSALSTAFPGVTVNVNISANIVRQNDEVTAYPTLEQLAQYCRQTSLDVVKTANYAGVSIFPSGNTIAVSDGTNQSSAPTIAINYTDLIGQPTWIESPNIQIKTVMRADLAVWSQIKLPPTLTINTAAANSYIVNQKLAFQGAFNVVSLRHVGRFRQPTADAWVSVIEAVPQQGLS